MRFLFLLCCLLPTFLFSADPSVPHDHQGLKDVVHFDGEPPKVELTPDELKLINEGQPVYKQTDKGSGGTAVAVFKVNASPYNVWKVITDFKSYPKWIDSLSETEIYKKEGDKVFVKFTIKKFLTTTTYFIEHNYPTEKKGWGTWKLDYSRLSDLDDSVGFWRVSEVSGKPDQSIVFYSVDVRMKGFVNLFKGFIRKEGLKEATTWVKEQAEALKASEPNALTGPEVKSK